MLIVITGTFEEKLKTVHHDPWGFSKVALRRFPLTRNYVTVPEGWSKRKLESEINKWTKAKSAENFRRFHDEWYSLTSNRYIRIEECGLTFRNR